MRTILVICGFILCLIGIQFLVVDKIVLHEGVMPPADPEGQFYEVNDAALRHIDLPDSGGFALVAVGIVLLMFSIGLRKSREKH